MDTITLSTVTIQSFFGEYIDWVVFPSEDPHSAIIEVLNERSVDK